MKSRQNRMFRKAAGTAGCLLLAGNMFFSYAQTAQAATYDNWIESDIQGNVTGETNVSPKDDYHAYVNKDWLASASIPDGEASFEAFGECEQILKERKLGLVQDTSLSSHDATLVRTLYNQAVDWESRNAAGVSEAMPYINAVCGISSMEDLNSYLMNEDANYLIFPFNNISVAPSLRDSSHYTVDIADYPYYLNSTDDYAEMSETGQIYYDYYSQIAAYALKRFGFSDADIESTWNGCMEFESMAAQAFLSSSDEETEESAADETAAQEDDSDDLSAYYRSFEEIKDNEGEFPLAEMLQAYGYGSSPDYYVENPDYIELLGTQLYTEANLPLLKSYILVHLATSLISKTDYAAYEETCKIGNEVYGTTGIKTGEEYGYAVLENYLPLCLDNLYMYRYCTQEMKQETLDIADEIITYYRQMLQGEDWLSDSTKAAAIEKLDKMKVNAIMPDKRQDYSDLELTTLADGGSYFKTILAVSKDTEDKQTALVGQAVDDSTWDMETSTANAYYDPYNNSINILAGNFVDPVYQDGESYEDLMAVIGTTIGHEISHAFDTNGAAYDANGNIADWWTEEDYTKFTDKAQTIQDYLDAIAPFADEPDLYVNGELAEAEFIADLVGMKATLAVAAQHEGFNYDEFFTRYALQWRKVTTKKNEILMMNTEEHPLNYLRVNCILQQFEEFYDTYGITEGDGMYLAPEERLELW